MPEPLKNAFGPEIPHKIGAMIVGVYPEFLTDAFLIECLDGYEALELTPRGWKIAIALRNHLPGPYEEAVKVLMASLGDPLASSTTFGMAPFLYMPYAFFIPTCGLDHFEVSMDFMHALTKRFTCEFSIRAFLERYPERTLEQLRVWAVDPDVHVRRLVSEGTRPRLPWASRLPQFQKDPGPVLELLELLKDDPELYVRRSVANNLNDIGKDHPELLAQVAQRWLDGAPPFERQWLVKHALRSAIKRGERGALVAMGAGNAPRAKVNGVTIEPAVAEVGGEVRISFELVSQIDAPQSLIVDYRVHFVKANGGSSPKVFKLKRVELASGQRIGLSTKISLREMTTRKHFPGFHAVEVVLNGVALPLGGFEVIGAP